MEQWHRAVIIFFNFIIPLFEHSIIPTFQYSFTQLRLLNRPID